MPRGLGRRLALVACVLAAGGALVWPSVDGRRWDAGRPVGLAQPGGPTGDPAATGRRWT